MAKQRARDKSDIDTKLHHIDLGQQDNNKVTAKYDEYFNILSQTISLLAENINMQMESEHADLFDRKLMSLYGVKNSKASLMDSAAPISNSIFIHDSSTKK